MTTDLLAALESGPACRFADWPNPDVPSETAGVYTIWDADVLLYSWCAGLTMIPITDELGIPRAGLWRALDRYAGGGSTPAFTLVMRTAWDQIEKQIALGKKSHEAARDHIRSRLTYRWIATDDYASAREIAQRVQQGALAAGIPVKTDVADPPKPAP